ncbi:MAG: polyprenyl diphosphate synthase [Dehalococcoidales bacterium]|nr:polyprenyl diphosphate synthase [Dehalococcoidales bacterium]
MPSHVAFIMDGNGRWAEQRGLSRIEGHKAGVESARAIITSLDEHHVKYATFYSFSTENWSRPRYEVSALLRLMEKAINQETADCYRRGFRLRHLGRLEGLSPRLQKAITHSLELTQNNTGLTVSLAFNYGSRAEILDAVKRVMAKGVPPEELDEKLFGNNLDTAGLPDVDLIIRTGGEIRISNFLMWQAAYAEYYFTPVLWPDFTAAELEKALQAYGQRQRRFGGLKSKDKQAVPG